METLTSAKKYKLEQNFFCTNMFKRCCFITVPSFKVIALYYRKLLGGRGHKVPPPTPHHPPEKYGPKYPMWNRVKQYIKTPCQISLSKVFHWCIIMSSRIRLVHLKILSTILVLIWLGLGKS